MSARMDVRAFHRTMDDGVSVSYSADMDDLDGLKVELREHGAYGQPDGEVVVVWLDTDPRPGNCIGTVSLTSDCEQLLATVEQAIKALEGVRDGLREAGHRDWMRPSDRG
jgi:hypothetical protein